MLKKILRLNGTLRLDKTTQKKISGGFIPGGGDSSECLYTGCFPNDENYGFIGSEGGPCSLLTPTSQCCTGIVHNNQCCIGTPF